MLRHVRYALRIVDPVGRFRRAVDVTLRFIFLDVLTRVLWRRKLGERGVRTWMVWRWNLIAPHGKNGDKPLPYLLRLYVLNTPLFGLKVHWFLGPDPDADGHDHPWTFASYLVCGGYQERRWLLRRLARDRQGLPGVAGELALIEGVVDNLRAVRGWIRRRSSDVHTITDIYPDTVTIVVNSASRGRSWGFWKPRGTGPILGHQYEFVPWRRYLGLPEKSAEV